MADTVTKVLEVVVDNNKAITSISEYNRLIDEQKQKQKDLADAFKSVAMSEADYYKAIAKSKEEVKAYSRSVQELSKEVQNNIKDAQEQEGSLRGLRAQLSNLTKEFDALSRAERNGEAGKAKMAEINRITTELKEAEAETQRFYRNVGNYPDVKPLEQQLGEVKKQLAQLKYEGKDNTEEFRELSAQAANMKDALADVEQQINATASDTKNLDTAVMGLSTAIGGMSLLSNVFSEDSEEGKKLNEILLKAQKILAVLNTLRMIQNNTQKQSLLGQALEKTQLTANNALRRTQTSLTVAQTAATESQTIAQRALNAATKAFPLFLLIGALTGLVALISKVGEWFGGAEKNLEGHKKMFEASKKAIDEYNKSLERTISIMDKLGKSDASKMQARLQGLINVAGMAKDLYKDSLELEEDQMKEAEQAYKDATTALNDYVEELRGEVLTMGEMFDLMNKNEGLQDFEIDLLGNQQKLADWTKLIAELVGIGKLDYTEADKAIKYMTAQVEKANKEILKKQFTAEMKHYKDLMMARTRVLAEVKNLEIGLMDEGYEKTIAQIDAKYEALRDDLWSREIDLLLTLRDVDVRDTQTRQIINDQIEALRQQRLALVKQNVEERGQAWEDELTRQKQAAIALNELELELLKEGSTEELNKKIEILRQEKELEIEAAKDNAEMKEAIEKVYLKREEDLRREHNNQMLQEAQEAIEKEWNNKLMEAANQGQQIFAMEVEAAKARMDALQQLEGESDADFKARQLEAEREYIAAKKALNNYELEIEQAKYDALEGMVGGLSQILLAFGEENEKLAKVGKILALAEIAVSTGKALAAGIAQASATGPWPLNLAAIGTTVATVLANIATAVSTVKSAKFATGGLVTGPGSSTSDSIQAQLSNGESVMNAKTTSMFGPLLSSLNQAGGGIAFNPGLGGQREGYEFLASAVAAGMKRVNLRVGVDEVTRVQNRVADIQELSTID